MKKLLLASAITLLLVTGCGKVAKLSDGKDAVITMGENDGISADELYDAMKANYALSVSLDLVDNKILSAKYPQGDEEKQYISNMKAQLKALYDSYYYINYSSYNSFLSDNYGVSSEEELDPIFSLNYKKNKASEDYAKEHLSEDELKKYYDDEVVGNIEASHILITADYTDDATEEEKQAAVTKAYETAKEVIAKLDNGADFATLAKEYSKDGSAQNGGALGEFNKGDMVDEFYEACLKLKVGEYTKEPVKTQYGYHVILKTKEHEKPSYEEVKEEIRETLAEEEMSSDQYFVLKTMIKIREENKVIFSDDDLKSQYETYKYNVNNAK